MFNLITLLASAAVLYFVLRYRIHIHINATPPESSAARRARSTTPKTVEIHPPSTLEGDLISALVNLGCKTAQARKAAQQAGNTGGFDAAFRRALEFAREAA